MLTTLSKGLATCSGQLSTPAAWERTLRLGGFWQFKRPTRTLEVAAEQMRLDVKHLQKIEAGKANVTLATLLGIATGLGEQLAIPLAGVGTQAAVAPRRAAVARPATRADNPPPLLKQVGQRLAELRLERDLSRSELARAARIPPAVLERIEWGRQQSVGFQQLARLAECVGVGIEALLVPPERPTRRGRPPRRTPSA